MASSTGRRAVPNFCLTRKGYSKATFLEKKVFLHVKPRALSGSIYVKQAFVLSTVACKEINDFKGQRSDCVPDTHQ